MVSHFVQNFHDASGKPINNVTMTAENKEIGFIGPRLPRVMTKKEVKALFREFFPSSDK